MTNIRIEDLRVPVRDAEQQQMFDLATSMEVDLAPNKLVAAAQRRTGLEDFGDPTLMDRLAAQVASVESDTGLSGLGRFLVRRRLVGLLAARLRLEDFIRRHPESLETELEPPVIVVGLPRSGTTHLVNLLATDTRFRSMPWWEVAEPIPLIGDGPGRDGIDPRYLRCQTDYESSKQVSPLTLLMHDRPPTSIEEECELLDLDLCTYVLEWHARVPQWRDHAENLDQFAHYAFLHRELQVLSYLRGPNRWVLKCPQHLERIGPLMATFPKATVAFTLRDPVAVLQSAITMLAYGDRNRRVQIDADQLTSYWVDRVERLLRAAMRDAHLIPLAQRVDVEFKEFISDDQAMAERIIEMSGLELTDQASTGLRQYIESNPRGKEGRIVYDLQGDFGLNPAELYERYAFYFDAFPQIRKEVH